jgi:hypothetical protein
MYIYDDHSDIIKYSVFKHSVEEPYSTSDSSEDFEMKIGNTTPSHFPCKLVIDSVLIQKINLI